MNKRQGPASTKSIPDKFLHSPSRTQQILDDLRLIAAIASVTALFYQVLMLALESYLRH